MSSAIFNYLKVTRFDDSIEVEDTGNCTLTAYNDEGKQWFLNIRTELGWSTVKEFGPVIAETSSIEYNFYYSYNKFEYKEKRLYKTIEDFVNNNRREITQIFEIDEEEFKSILDNIEES